MAESCESRSVSHYGFLLFSLVVALSLVVLFKMTWHLLPFSNGEMFSASIISESHNDEVDSFAWSLGLRSPDTVLLPGELLLVEVIVTEKMSVVEGVLHFNYPGNALDLVRVSTRESVMNHESVPLHLELKKTAHHGSDISFDNTALNGALVQPGTLMTLYFTATDIGEGVVSISPESSSLSNVSADVGSVLPVSSVNFRVE